MSTFERLTLSEYDDGPCPWPADVYRTALKAAYAEMDRLEAEDLARADDRIVYYESIIAEKDAEIDRLRAAYTEMDRMAATSNEAADILRTGAYDEDDDLLTLARNAHDAQVHLLGQSDKYRLEAKDLAAERDRLRANALNWVTVTDDPVTLPKGIGAVILVLVGEEWWHQASLGANGDVRRWRLASGKWERLSVGDRWAYIPQPTEVL